MRQTKMTKKENYNRYRCKTLVFTQSNVEKERINNLVYLSGMSKQDYIIRRLLDEEVVAIPNIKVQKHIREMLKKVNCQLIEQLKLGNEPTMETKEIISVISMMMNDMKGEEDDRQQNNEI